MARDSQPSLLCTSQTHPQCPHRCARPQHLCSWAFQGTAWASLGTGSAADKSWASCPSQAKMRLSRSLKVYSNSRGPRSHPQDIKGEMGRVLWKGRKKGGVGQEDVGRASAVPTDSPGLPHPKLSHLRAFPGLPPAWELSPATAQRLPGGLSSASAASENPLGRAPLDTSPRLHTPTPRTLRALQGSPSPQAFCISWAWHPVCAP